MEPLHRLLLCQTADAIQETIGGKPVVIIMIRYPDAKDGGPTVEAEFRGDRVEQLGMLKMLGWKLAQDANEGPDADSYKIKKVR